MDSARSRSAAQSGGLGIASSNVRGSTTADAAAGSTAAPGVIPVPRRSGTIRAGLGGGPGSQAAAPAPPPPVVSKPLPEVHILGEIAGGSGFASGNGGTLGSGAGAPVCCKFSVETGDKWEWLGGHRSGQTHTVHPESGSDFSVWSHPIDLHYAAGSISVSCWAKIGPLPATNTQIFELLNGRWKGKSEGALEGGGQVTVYWPSLMSSAFSPFSTDCFRFAGLAATVGSSVGAGSFWPTRADRVRLRSRSCGGR